MSGTVIYKGETLTTISNGATKVLKTAGKFMEDDVTIAVSADGGGGSGNIWQDENGYIHLDDEGGGTPTPTPTPSGASKKQINFIDYDGTIVNSYTPA